MGTSTGAVLMLKVVIAGSASGGGELFAMPRVDAVPFRMVCASDDRPVSMMAFVLPGRESTGRKGEEEDQPPVVVASSVSTVSPRYQQQ